MHPVEAVQIDLIYDALLPFCLGFVDKLNPVTSGRLSRLGSWIFLLIFFLQCSAFLSWLCSLRRPVPLLACPESPVLFVFVFLFPVFEREKRQNLSLLVSLSLSHTHSLALFSPSLYFCGFAYLIHLYCFFVLSDSSVSLSLVLLFSSLHLFLPLLQFFLFSFSPSLDLASFAPPPRLLRPFSSSGFVARLGGLSAAFPRRRPYNLASAFRLSLFLASFSVFRLPLFFSLFALFSLFSLLLHSLTFNPSCREASFLPV